MECIWKLSTASTLIFLAGACGTANPTDNEARTALEQAVMEDLDGAVFTIDEFAKTNGQTAEINGVANYTYFYTAVVSFPEGYRTECLNRPDGLDGYFVGLRCAQDFNFSNKPFRPDYPGGFVQVKGTVPFSHSENGWLAGQPTIEVVD